jgi:hypothetical protein
MKLHRPNKKLKAIKKRALKKLEKKIMKESLKSWDFLNN